MEKQAVVDASVVAKWYLVEKFSEQALRLRDMHISGEIELVAPELLYLRFLIQLDIVEPFPLKNSNKWQLPSLAMG